MNHIIKNVDI